MPQSSTVINGTEYTSLATKYGLLVRALTAAATTYLYQALTIVAQLDEVEPTRDLIVPFDNVYQQQVATLTGTTQFLEVVRALNNHVLSRARTAAGNAYTDLNDWFADQEDEGYAVSFPQEWADMSDLVGQDIDDYVG